MVKVEYFDIYNLAFPKKERNIVKFMELFQRSVYGTLNDGV